MRAQLNHRRGAALHDHLSLAHRQDHIPAALVAQAHAVGSLEQRGPRLSLRVRHHADRRIAEDLHAHALKRTHAGLCVFVDHRQLHVQQHRAGGRVLKGHTRAIGQADRRNNAVLRRFPAAHAACSECALGQLDLTDGIALRLIAGEHRLAVFIGRHQRAPAVLAGRFQHNARHRHAQGIHGQDRQLAGHRIAHHDLLARHRDERLIVEEIPLRRTLLAQIEFRTLRQRKARFPLTCADAHGLAGIQRVGPRRQLARAGEDVHAKLRARQRVNDLRFIAARLKGEALHAQADCARGAGHLHGRNVNVIADALFLCRGRLSMNQHSAQKQHRALCNRSLVHHISPSLQSRLKNQHRFPVS